MVRQEAVPVGGSQRGAHHTPGPSPGGLVLPVPRWRGAHAKLRRWPAPPRRTRGAATAATDREGRQGHE